MTAEKLSQSCNNIPTIEALVGQLSQDQSKYPFKQKQLTLTVDASASNAKQSVLLLLTFDIANRKFSYYRKYYLPLFLKIKTGPRKLTFSLIFSAWFCYKVVTVF